LCSHPSGWRLADLPFAAAESHLVNKRTTIAAGAAAPRRRLCGIFASFRHILRLT